MSELKISIREIKSQDNPFIAQIIREVMPEFGADGPGFAIVDPEVDRMFETYDLRDAIYYVVLINDKVVGGAGLKRLAGTTEEESICELQKMYFLKEVRGHGIGQEVITKCLNFACEQGYKHCYIETLSTMDQARALYLKNGFSALGEPMGKTGHFSCDAWYIKDLGTKVTL